MSQSPIPFEPIPQRQYSEPPTISDVKKLSRSSSRVRRGERSGGSLCTSDPGSSPIIVHSHLGWNWVWQRPQQFISRLSRQHKVLFVETLAPDPTLATPLVRFQTPKDFPNLTVLTLQFPAWRWPDGAYVDAARRQLVQEFLAGPAAGQFDNPIQWFYDPMAVTAFLGHMGEILTVYDCMDELSKFRGAPKEIVQRELDLLGRADVVFTGGRRLYESKRRLHHNCHFYGCGVDAAHFGKARSAATTVPADIAALPQPVLGYFGVVDERMDYDLIAQLADANPSWSIAMVGPTIKIAPESLPSRSNLHWLGQRSYDDLPAICKGFAACLMPFALNEATEFINPTKALEYMATGRPIISSAVPDVVRNFGSVVKVAHGADEFVALCREALARPDTAALERGLEMAAENSWESIVASLERHIREALQAKALAPAGEPTLRSNRRRSWGARALTSSRLAKRKMNAFALAAKLSGHAVDGVAA